MKTFAVMVTVSFEDEVYIQAENLPEAMEKLQGGEVFCDGEKHDFSTWDERVGAKVTYTPLDFIKPQVWSDEAGDFIHLQCHHVSCKGRNR